MWLVGRQPTLQGHHGSHRVRHQAVNLPFYRLQGSSGDGPGGRWLRFRQAHLEGAGRLRLSEFRPDTEINRPSAVLAGFEGGPLSGNDLTIDPHVQRTLTIMT